MQAVMHEDDKTGHPEDSELHTVLKRQSSHSVTLEDDEFSIFIFDSIVKSDVGFMVTFLKGFGWGWSCIRDEGSWKFFC